MKEKTQGLRHYLARLHRKTLCYSKSVETKEVFNPFAAALLEVQNGFHTCLNHYPFSNATEGISGVNKILDDLFKYLPFTKIGIEGRSQRIEFKIFVS